MVKAVPKTNKKVPKSKQVELAANSKADRTNKSQKSLNSPGTSADKKQFPLSHIRMFLAPPIFPDDEDKTRLARMLNTILLSAMVFLLLLVFIAIPFIFYEKLFNTIGALVFLAVLGVAYGLMQRGRVQLASILFTSGLWLIFTLLVLFAGGMTSAMVIFFLVGTVAAGLLLGTWSALIYAAACCAAGLAMIILETNGHPLPRLFPVSPVVGWVDLAIALLSTTIVLRIVTTGLQEALLLTRQHLEERIQAERALRESEERYSRLSTAASEGIGISDEGKIADANPQLARMMGYDPGELIGLSVMDFVAPESCEMVLANEKAGFDGPYEHLAIKKDGTIFPVEIRARTIPYKGRQTRVAIIRDITEHKRADDDLTRQIERLRALHTIDQAVISSVDLDMILSLFVKEVVEQLHVDASAVLLVNQHTQTLDFAARQGFHTDALRYSSLKVGTGLAGQAAKERKTVHVADLAEMDNNPSLAEAIAQEGFVTYFGIPLIAKDRLHGILEIFHRSTLAPDPDWLRFLETLAGQAAISIDNARLLEMTQKSLKETNALYRINQDLVATIDPDLLMMTVVNLLQESFGYHYVQIFVADPKTGDFVVRAGSGETGKQLVSQGYRLAAGEGIVGITADTGAPFFTNDVNQLISFVRNPLLPDTKSELAVPIMTGAQFLGLLDIHQVPPSFLTERDVQLVNAIAGQLAVALQKAQLYSDLQNSLLQEKAARTQLIQAEKLAVAGRLMASVSHELNNPLQAIQNALFLLNDEGGLSEQGQQDMKIVLSETERMATLLDRLRTTYQPVQAEDFQPVQINNILEDVHALVATHLRHAHISFEFLSDPNLPSIAGLNNQLKQVFLNLFMNAVDSMTKGGHLTLSTHWMEGSRQILITVTDTGTGIDESLLPDIFEAFITNKEKGTGLGLAISYEIVLKHRGRIQAKNNPEGGATFSIWLPVGNGGRTLTIAGKILVIDDELILRQTLARILQRAGFEVTTAENGEQGLAFLETTNFDLIYLDIRMPGLAGPEVLKLVHLSHPTIPVVLFTAQPDINSAVEALRSGATDYLLKPLKPETIIERTRTILAVKQKEQRKREIQAQVEILQAELRNIDNVEATPPAKLRSVTASERYLKRGALVLDLHARRLTIGEELINLPPTSFDYLLVLARHAPDVVDYQTLVAEAQGFQAETREAKELSKWHIHHIRQAIEPDEHESTYLFNVRGVGYRLLVN